MIYHVVFTRRRKLENREFQLDIILEGSVGYQLCTFVINLLTAWIYFRVCSSFMTCAILPSPIFSRALRRWIPTFVAPIGQGAFPMASLRYTSLARTYSLISTWLKISTSDLRRNGAVVLPFSWESRGLRFSSVSSHRAVAERPFAVFLTSVGRASSSAFHRSITRAICRDTNKYLSPVFSSKLSTSPSSSKHDLFSFAPASTPSALLIYTSSTASVASIALNFN
mmetsp:Transcript_19069/g.47862  ORF Transcript_19069/g.47862 Transcript_19069/m.47862 type:complete len:225 (+) Transcript_19069:131-805(+)